MPNRWEEMRVKIRKWTLVLLIAGLGMIAGVWLPFDPGDALPGPLVYAETKGIQVELNGQDVVFDVQPQYRNERTYVPFRKLLEALGATVTWEQATQTATAVKDGLTLTIPLGSHEINLQGHPLKMDMPVILVDDRTLVPLRYVAQALGARVDWTQGEQADRIRITQSYDVMIDRLVNGKTAPGDMQVTYDQAAILFEWLYKGQEKGGLPGFTASKAIDNYPIPGEGDEYVSFWQRFHDENGSPTAYSKLTKEIYTLQYRFGENTMYDNQTRQPLSSYISIADQTKNQILPARGKYIVGYYPQQ